MTTVEEAVARLAARSNWKLTCWACDHTSEVDADPLRREYQCDQCGATTAYGEPQARFTLTPYTDRRFHRLSFESGRGDKKTGVDIILARGYASALALEILSVSEPEVYSELERLMAKR